MSFISKVLALTLDIENEAKKEISSTVSLILEVKEQITSMANSVVKIADRVRAIEEIVVIHQKAIEEMYKLQKSFNENMKDSAAEVLPERRKNKIEKPN